MACGMDTYDFSSGVLPSKLWKLFEPYKVLSALNISETMGITIQKHMHRGMEEEASSSSLSMEDNKVNIDIDMDKRIVDATENMLLVKMCQPEKATDVHQIVVLHQRAIYQAPNKYILPRWSKAVRRRHTRVRISYDKRSQTPEVLRFEKTCNAFHELADMARNSEERWEKVAVMVNQLHEEMKGGGCLRKQ
ncbi:hypothetical protein RHGRI_032976 [Rhododendron griersonianum]|uniref:Protein FAR1-RELATED SEQUENCE n=1 Tax=Rhododendron griersonianum TaxID=479676 RepID=A0AAV6IEH6_9ERIC|nr:hypothetical protein RHGRI_032976 [Rhododendron griersonianum]